MDISQRLKKLKPSATLAVSAKAKKLKAEGKKILSLSLGEPDFNTPQHICDAAKKAIDDGFTRYTQSRGLPEVLEAVCGYFKKFYNVDANIDEVMLTNGGKQGLYNIFQTILNPGDEVLIPAPYWVSYPDMVELADAVPVTVAASAEENFKINVKSLEKRFTNKTKALILNSPSNPTGVCYTQEELDTLVKWAISKNLIVISDEIYDQLVYDPIKPISLSPWWKKSPNNIVIVNGLAKSFAMTGWRVGYVLGSEEIIKAMGKLQGQSTANVCSIAQKATQAALNGSFDCVKEMNKVFARRRDLAYSIISKWKDVTCPKPEGAFYIFPDVHKHYTPQVPDSTSLCNLLLEKAGVAAVPGIAFGDDRCIRLSYATDDKTLVEALEKIENILFKL
ncbi:pyridoxal phosphate-dependent aminotransferase [Desulfovibrio litoralis]|uniref:Aminotransferase n=1 Tax=Desulfovibrio litoralis DSM 11393 TaxID=1121455 RepID=A0A1M7T471_9BACT|nr:pyridoxal phosphate-dependent aminotransferase [Desulfovibrio litoralis]SHN65467.1 L-aspartate aminotransferase apoenzyme [Desulfovibrio litoralis DSM 11393]